MDKYTHRRLRLQQVIESRFGGSQAEFSKEASVSPAYLSRILNPESAQHKRIGENLARNVEARLRLPSGWLDDEGASKAREPTTLYGITISREGAVVGAEWDKLHEPLRTQIQVLIETLVAKQVRRARKKKEATKGTQRQAQPNG
jgi:transcriptional regulator with XRE-family HTH domain